MCLIDNISCEFFTDKKFFRSYFYGFKSKRTKDDYLKETEFEFLQININQHFAQQKGKLLTAASLRKKLIKHACKQTHTQTERERDRDSICEFMRQFR